MPHGTYLAEFITTHATSRAATFAIFPDTDVTHRNVVARIKLTNFIANSRCRRVAFFRRLHFTITTFGL
jgi:hypothetical protein